MSVISTPLAPDSRARNRLQDLSMSQEIHEHSENSTLEPQAMNDLKNVRDDYESSKPEKADHDNELDKISYISTLDPAARYDISKNHDNVESSILYPSAYNDLNDISIDLKKKKTILLLYLNKNTILHERDNLTETINAVKNAGIDIVLVHEQDSERDWINPILKLCICVELCIDGTRRYRCC